MLFAGTTSILSFKYFILNDIVKKLKQRSVSAGNIFSSCSRFACFLLSLPLYQSVREREKTKLISIFDSYTLNTSKYLDFLAFKKAFILYTDRNNLTGELIAQIIELKNDMNYNREDYNMVINHEIIITKS